MQGEGAVVCGGFVFRLQLVAFDSASVGESPAENPPEIAGSLDAPSGIGFPGGPAVQSEPGAEHFGPTGAIAVIPNAITLGENGATKISAVAGGNTMPRALPCPGWPLGRRHPLGLFPPARPAGAGYPSEERESSECREKGQGGIHGRVFRQRRYGRPEGDFQSISAQGDSLLRPNTIFFHPRLCIFCF